MGSLTALTSHTAALLLCSYLICYLLCGIPFALLISRFCVGVDIRTRGSGNVGSTNMLRELGVRWGILTFILDCGKGILSCLIVVELSQFAHGSFVLNPTHLFLCVAGHIFSIYLKGRGGKGIATGLGAALMVCPICALIALACFIAVVISSRYVSLGSLSAAVALPISYLILQWPPSLFSACFVIMTGILVIWAHRSNIRKIKAHQERRLGSKS